MTVIGTAPALRGSALLKGHDLRRVPLVRQMLDDAEIRIVARPIDQNWSYNGHAESAVGWNPWSGELYIGAHSVTSRWRKRQDDDLRVLNERDFLLRELLFLTHDYLHAWAVRVIQARCPELGFGSAPLAADKLETHAFLLLLSEAVATVGLDYWYLSTVALNDVLDIGTCIELLTTAYRERDLGEYRKFFPRLQVQSPAFFRYWTEFYMSGDLNGFGVEDLRASPKLYTWLNKELRYGERQRIHARQWLRYLAGETGVVSEAALGARVAADAPWQRALIEELGLALWNKVKEDEAAPTPPSQSIKGAPSWRAPDRGLIDFRYTNALAFEDLRAAIEQRGMVEDSFEMLFAQVLATIAFDAHQQQVVPELKAIKQSRSWQRLLELASHHPAIPAEPGSEAARRELMFQG